MAMNVGSQRGLPAGINMTPMIDILLVLLIIFMAISPVHPKGLEALAPSTAPPEAPSRPDVPVVVQIAGDGSIKINQEDSSWDRLESRLVDIFKMRADKTVFVQGDRDLDFQAVARAIDIAHGASISRIGLMIGDKNRPAKTGKNL